MTPVFLDTVGLLAMWDRTDQWHRAASDAMAQLMASRTRMFTTTFILLECGNAASRRPYRRDIDDLRQRLEAEGNLVVPSEHDWYAAWQSFRRNDYANASIVDHISFIVMRRLAVITAFTNDRHYQAAGFDVLF